MSEIAGKSNGKGLRSLFITIAVVLSASILVTYLMGRWVLAANQAVIRRQAVVDEMGDSLSTMKDAETGQRGYLLTGEQSFLQPFTEAVNHIHSEAAAFGKDAGVYGVSSEDIARYQQLIDLKLAELDRTIALQREGKFNDAMTIVRSGEGKQYMDEMRVMTTRIIGTQEGELAALMAKVQMLTVIRSAVFAIATLVDLAFIYWAYKRICSERLKREAAGEELRRQKELLQVTLASIGDGVIVTDDKAQITFINEIGEKLTGWTAAEASGRPCTEVFNIVNEETRQLVESPVDKVLRLGLVVGLANHTILIRKDKTELPIDDSGAPIREGSNIRGVVLVFRDFTAQKQAESELRAAKEAAESANVAKDNFLATLSHELRTPLTPVVVTLSEWEQSPTLPAELLADVQMMRRNIDLEARLIDDLLDLTRIVRGKLSLNLEFTDVHELISSVTRIYQSDINAKRLKVALNLEASQHFVYADPGRLQQIFWNILKNATKFTPEGGAIEVQTSNSADGAVRISIQDNGIGMAPETLARLFRPFEQGDDEIVKRYGGLGLGMAISKALVDAQGGEIAAKSEGSGRGSTFTVSLKAVTAPQRSNGSAPAVLPDAPHKPLHILLVEDHADTARAMSRLLRNLGHRVSLADTVTSAMERIGETEFGLVLSDLGLPDGTGIDLIKQIRQTKTVPAVALTGFGMEEDIATCKEAGFDEHLTKPISFQKLETVIRRYSGK